MNPFARLLDPAAPVPQLQSMQGRVHILADEIDHSTMAPASKPGPKPPANGELHGLPRLEVRYELDDSVFLVSTPSGTVIVQVYFPVACWVPTAPTVADWSSAKPSKPSKLMPAPGPGPAAYRVKAARGGQP